MPATTSAHVAGHCTKLHQQRASPMEVGEGCSVYYLELIKAHGFATFFLAGRQFHAHRQTRGLLELARSPDQPRAYKDGRLRAGLWAILRTRGCRQPRDLLDPARSPDQPRAYKDRRLRARLWAILRAHENRQTRDLLDPAHFPDRPRAYTDGRLRAQSSEPTSIGRPVTCLTLRVPLISRELVHGHLPEREVMTGIGPVAV